MSNLNQCQNTLRDDFESSILTRWFVTVGHEESTFSLYRLYPLRRAIKTQLIELSMSPLKEEILLNKIIQPLSRLPLQLFYLASEAYVSDIHDKDPWLNGEQARTWSQLKPVSPHSWGPGQCDSQSKRKSTIKIQCRDFPGKAQNLTGWSTHQLLFLRFPHSSFPPTRQVSWPPTTSFEIKYTHPGGNNLKFHQSSYS